MKAIVRRCRDPDTFSIDAQTNIICTLHKELEHSLTPYVKYIRMCLLLSSVLALSSVRGNVHGLCKTSITRCAAVEHDAYLLSVLQALGYSAVSGNDNLLQLREKKGEGRGGEGGEERGRERRKDTVISYTHKPIRRHTRVLEE